MFAETIAVLRQRGRTENVAYVLWPDPEFRIEGAAGIGRYDPRARYFPYGIVNGIIGFPQLLHTLRREMPDIIYVYHPSLCILMAAIAGKILGLKVVARRFAKKDMVPPLSKLADKVSYFLCDSVVALSEDSARELEEMGLARDKICCIHNGKDPAAYRSDRGKAEAKRAIGIREKDFVFGMVGRISRTKGQETAIRALAKVAHDSVRLVITGKDDHGDQERLVKLADESGLGSSVIFTGPKAEVKDVLGAFDVFVHASVSEGCPGAVLEAMCAGLPIIAAEEGASREVLGGCALFVPCGDEGKLAIAMKRIIRNRDLGESLGARAGRRVRRKFSPDAMAGRYEALFQSIVREPLGK